MYSTIPGVRLEIDTEMYSSDTIDSLITETDERKVIRWINNATQRTTNFTEVELEGTASIIRLAACEYSACSILSSPLAGHGVDQESLARVRCAEAKDSIRMWCAVNGVVPSFDIVIVDDRVQGREVTEYAYVVGSDEVCITGG